MRLQICPQCELRPHGRLFFNDLVHPVPICHCYRCGDVLAPYPAGPGLFIVSERISGKIVLDITAQGCHYTGMDESKYTIEDLCDLTGFSRRTIRYYVQSGIINAPAGRGRGGFYFDSQLDKLRQIRALQEQGLTLQAIQSRLTEGKVPEITSRQGVWVRYEVAPGVEIHISRERELTEGRRIVELIRAARAIMKEEEQP